MWDLRKNGTAEEIEEKTENISIRGSFSPAGDVRSACYMAINFLLLRVSP